MLGLLVNLCGYLLLLLAGSLCMCGFYKVTRHGMLLGFWSDYFEAITPEARELQKEIDLYKHQQQLNEIIGHTENAADYYDKVVFYEGEKQLYKDCGLWYKLPGYIVHPISGCVYCYSSLYGSLFFWIAGYALAHVNGFEPHFSWHLIVVWISFILSSIALNGIIIKKVL